jgi:rod shape-determining protein MreD
VNVRRTLFVAVLVLTAVMLELTLLSRLGLPGATPDLTLVCVAAVALVRGPAVGASTGFAAGLLLDLAPPSDAPLGTWATLFALAGYVVGMLAAGGAERSVWLSVGVVALAGAAVVLGRALLGGMLADPRVVTSEIPLLMLTEALYAAFLAVFVVPLVRAVDSRLGSETSSSPRLR